MGAGGAGGDWDSIFENDQSDKVRDLEKALLLWKYSTEVRTVNGFSDPSRIIEASRDIEAALLPTFLYIQYGLCDWISIPVWFMYLCTYVLYAMPTDNGSGVAASQG